MLRISMGICIRKHELCIVFYEERLTKLPIDPYWDIITRILSIKPRTSTSVWSPLSVHLIDMVESVQRKFAKRLYPNLSYNERLKLFNLKSLEERENHV